MLVGSFYSTLSGLQANAQTLNVVGNNLANVNTAGFKRGQADFEQMMGNSLSSMAGNSNPNQVGFGTTTASISQRFEQGALETTGFKTQLALQGDGFFPVSNNGEMAFTRVGNFSFDEQGYLVAANGGRVQGYTSISDAGLVNTNAGRSDMQVNFGKVIQPKSTDVVRFISSLNADAAEADTHTSTVEIFDSKGVAHQLSLTFTKTDTAGEWDFGFNASDGTFSPTGDFPTSGRAIFDQNGKLEAIGPAAGPFVFVSDAGSADVLNLNLTGFANGAEDLSMTWDLEDDSSNGTVSYVSERGGVSATSSLYQDGRGSGALQDISIAQDGTILGFYSNGISRPLGQVAVATFANNHGLKQLDANFFNSTNSSGAANFIENNDGTRASIFSNTLERSNVDIAEEFTTMILGQRAFQSNSRAITNIDSLLQESLNLKR